jgi:hypothetical protein
MKKFILGFAMFLLAVVAPAALVAQTAAAPPPVKPLKIVLARQSTVNPVAVVKNFGQKCPNVMITTNPKNSDLMLNAGGWSGSYNFMLIAHGGDTIFATQTTLLSNAVKDVCNFLAKRAPSSY